MPPNTTRRTKTHIIISFTFLFSDRKWIIPQMGMRDWLHHIHISDWLIASLSMCAEQRTRYMLFPIRAQHSLESAEINWYFDRWRRWRSRGGKLNDHIALSTVQPWWNTIWISHTIMWRNRESGFLTFALSCSALHDICCLLDFAGACAYLVGSSLVLVSYIRISI